MSGRHRNQVVPVFRVFGISEDSRVTEPQEIFKTTIEKALRLVDSRLAILRDDKAGVDGGIELTVKPKRFSDRPDSPACVESAAVQAGFRANGGNTQESSGELAEYFRSRSPWRWAERPRITKKRAA